MEPIKLFDCLECEHLDRENLVIGFYCLAFPEGIIDEIVIGEKIHNEVIKGQQGDFIFKQYKTGE